MFPACLARRPGCIIPASQAGQSAPTSCHTAPFPSGGVIAEVAAGRTVRIGSDIVVVGANRLVVLSRTDMPDWVVRAHRRACVRFDGRDWHMASRTTTLEGLTRYELTPWSSMERELPGITIEYDDAYVTSRDQRAHSERRREAGSRLLSLVAPLTGFLPMRVKDRLEVRYGIDPVRSTRHSLYLEVLLVFMAGAAASIGMMANGLSRGLVIPVWPFMAMSLVSLVDSVVRWGRVLEEQRPPPGFLEWIKR